MHKSQGSNLSQLAAHWSSPGTPAGGLAADTRDALSTVQPSDLTILTPLAEALLARLGDPDAREAARRALFTLLDICRRRFFTEALSPELVDPWLSLLLPAIERADYTFG